MEDELIQVSTCFSPQDIKTAYKLSQDLYGIKVKEVPT
jgi:hypothetical protein